MRFQLHLHQKSGVWRIVQTPNTLLGHVVGAGKTFTMVAAGMELKRLGLARKPMFAVPNHMLGQFHPNCSCSIQAQTFWRRPRRILKKNAAN